MAKKRSYNNKTAQRKAQKTTNERKKNIIKVRQAGGLTLKAAQHAKIGDTEIIDGEVHTIRSERQIRELIKAMKYDEVRRTCTTLVTDMSGMFRGHSSFNEPIQNWDTSQVTSMASMFNRALRFNRPIGSWDTSRVVNMRSMFTGARAFNQPIGSWDVRNVVDMAKMFTGASAFNQDLSDWYIRWNVLGNGKMDKTMFYGTSMSNQKLQTLSNLWGQTFRRSPPRVRQSHAITDWTSGLYREVQNARRKGATLQKNSKRVNTHLAQYFRDTHIRAPYRPKMLGYNADNRWLRKAKPLMYLYRGLHGPLANKFVFKGKIVDKGYMAFSRDLDVASDFAEKNNFGIVLELAIDSIPPGTPWLWYNYKLQAKKGSNAHKSHAMEDEVLLPPGTLERVGPSNSISEDLHRVRYIPDIDATSANGKRMYRKKKSTNSTNNNTNDLVAWFSRLFN